MTPTIERVQLALPSRDLSLHAVVATPEGPGGDAAPLVLFCHGFPGLSYSFRHQLPVVAAAGYRAVALDMKGYGRSDRPLALEAYQANVVADDLAAALDALGADQAVVVGHDFGAKAAFGLARRHPGRVRALVSLAVPYGVQFAGGKKKRASKEATESSKRGRRPSETYAAIAERHFFHMHYFQAVGPAERELGARPREYLHRVHHALSRAGNLLDWRNHPSDGTGYLDVLAPAPPLAWDWLTEEDMDHMVAEFTRGPTESHFIGGLSCYRVADLDWEHDPDYGRTPIEHPTLFIVGERDPVLQIITPESISAMKTRLPQLRGAHTISGAGHFVQQERPAETNALLLDFLRAEAPPLST